MKNALSLILLFCSLNVFSQADKKNDFNLNWSFFKDESDSLKLDQLKETDFHSINLPHDWSIEDLKDQSDDVIGPFSTKSRSKKSTGFTIGGTGWYLKKFITSKEMDEKIISINFDGVYMNADVWINGKHLGNHAYGYTPFSFDISEFINPIGKENNIIVQVKNWGRNSRWYSGSGIYRKVNLDIKNRFSIPENGIYITTPKITPQVANINIEAKFQNQSLLGAEYEIRTTIIAPDKTQSITSAFYQKVKSNEAYLTKEIHLNVKDPKLWDLQSPNLYTAVIEIYEKGKKIDTSSVKFGIRTIAFNAQDGFLLNGKMVKLKGGNIHHDQGILGATAYSAAELRKIQLLKDNGFNAVRISHNPPSEDLLNICDELGILVIDETFDMWNRLKNKQDYSRYFDSCWEKDLEAMIVRDRNHPCIIMWSIGNEIYERIESEGLKTGKKIVEKIKELDRTRPTTEAICEFINAKGGDWAKTAPAFDIIDVAGYNYQWREYEKDHAKYPNRIIYGSESYPKEAFENWSKVAKLNYVIGDFVWTAQDYLGEAGLANAEYVSENDLPKIGWSWINSWCGDLDLIGEKKPQSYFRDVLWDHTPIQMLVHEPIPRGEKEVVSLWGWRNELPRWTWDIKEREELNVRVFSKAPKVRLKLNGIIVGEKSIDSKNGIIAEFQVPYEAGTLEAFNIVDGKETDKISIKTFETVSVIELTVKKWQFHDDKPLYYVLVQLRDKYGNIVTNQDREVQFSVKGNAKILASGNANPKEPQSYQAGKCKTFRGKGLVIIEIGEGGDGVCLSAKSDSLSSSLQL